MARRISSFLGEAKRSLDLALYDIRLPDEGVGTALIAPIEQVDILPPLNGRRQIGLLRGGDNQRHRAERLVVGDVHELRRRPSIDRHEAGAANMAEAYGKLTNRPGICLVTRGPGATQAPSRWNLAAGSHIPCPD